MINPRARDISADWLEHHTVFRRYDDFISHINKIMTLPDSLREVAFEAVAIVHVAIAADVLGAPDGVGCDIFVAGDYEKLLRLSDGREGEPSEILGQWEKAAYVPALAAMEDGLMAAHRDLRVRYGAATDSGKKHLAERVSGLGNLAAYVMALADFAATAPKASKRRLG